MLLNPMLADVKLIITGFVYSKSKSYIHLKLFEMIHFYANM